ncbi:MAG: hypothetical protein ABJ308_10200 [Halieaceae bacterium]
MIQAEHQSELDEALRKIGRNVLNIQRMEAMLKFLVSRSNIEGKASELRSNQEKAVAAVTRQTMGNLVKSFVGSVYATPSEIEDEADVEIDEVWIRLSFRIEADSAHIEQRQAELNALVEERNKLIHQLLGEFDQTSIESCRKLGELLDEQAERVRPEYEKLKSLILVLNDARKEAFKAIEEQLITGATKGKE